MPLLKQLEKLWIVTSEDPYGLSSRSDEREKVMDQGENSVTDTTGFLPTSSLHSTSFPSFFACRSLVLF